MTFEVKMTKDEIIDGLRSTYGKEFTAADVRGFCAANDIAYQTVTKKLKEFSVGRGKWNLEVTTKAVENIEKSFSAPAVEPTVTQDLVPTKDDTFVKFGPFNDVKKVIQSKQFYPTFITGLSGNGKTVSVEQVCAILNRECVRVNITIETDEDDLIGGFRLVNGDTVFHNGPVVEALERGAVLLLDEIDLASNKILCLQSVLEGKGVFLKKTGRYVKPAAGFTVIATANTKGKGSDDGRFVGTNVLNEAFLERFPITIEQEYPSVAVEKNIVTKLLDSLGCPDPDFAAKLVSWSDIIRKTFYDGGVDEIIATRRLAHICKAYSIFGDRLQAIELCINRFDEETKTSFKDLYTKVDADVNGKPEEVKQEEPELTEDSDLTPF